MRKFWWYNLKGPVLKSYHLGVFRIEFILVVNRGARQVGLGFANKQNGRVRWLFCTGGKFQTLGW